MYDSSKYPTFFLGYRGAFSSMFGTSSRYDFVRFGMRQRKEFGIDDHFSYSLTFGKYLNNNALYFEDFQHFNTQSTTFLFSSYDNSFRLLPFYQYSTGKQFAEAHFNWQTRRLIVKQLPFIRNTTIAEKLFVNFLSTPEIKNYMEAGYGLNNVFLLMNLEAVAGFENGKFRSAGFRVSLNIK